MKFKFVLLLVFTIFLGCKSSLPKDFQFVNGQLHNVDYQCNELFREISKKWAKNYKYPNCYLYDARLVTEILQNKECLIGRKMSELVEIFGEPQYEGNRYEYHLYSKNGEISSHKKPFILLFYPFIDDEIGSVHFSIQSDYYIQNE